MEGHFSVHTLSTERIMEVNTRKDEMPYQYPERGSKGALHTKARIPRPPHLVLHRGRETVWP